MAQLGVTKSKALKLLIVGDSNVGKSCILMKFCDSSFTTEHDTTIGVDFRFTDIKIDNEPIKLQIWDTAGQEKFRSITNTYYRNSDGIMIVYDVTSQYSFNRLDGWFSEILASAPKGTKIVLVGNKCDLEDERVISFEEGEEFAKQQSCPFFELSAKSGFNISNSFHCLSKLALENQKQKKTPNFPSVIDPDKTQKKSKCC
ncbi:ras and ef-hand domain-containing protein [Anaeramoeba ignava]|uniref:Ras and ef-hand domain-containing protein n=1 Tax=Anaeramoeba ignava TaxID=1746090 RepID=A0A9Q0L931_ANAIG|nr:ras and ef-hand domain-containing protein [Anaeramoeba ignava]